MTDLDATLRERFGFAGFRPGQREVIEAVLNGEDLLVVQPTGHGKSLSYQLPAVVLGGVTLVISPLLALMRDQLGHLGERFSIPAGSLNSDQDEAENEAVRKAAANGELSVVFVSPEQLDNVERLAFLVSLRPVLVVIDEAHCVSTWGHDFRPAYREIARVVGQLRAAGQRPRVLALTATADAATEADVVRQLGLTVVRHPMDRPNLALGVRAVHGLGEKLALLDVLVGATAGTGLLYCATREATEIVAEYLASRGHAVEAYHAGLEPDRKRALQQRFLTGGLRAIAATNALGMGIDKSDLRYVVHVDVPGSITAYYQEVGRAGRDGAPAAGWLLYDPADLAVQEYFIHAAQPTAADFASVRAAVADAPQRLQDLKRRTGLHPTRVTVVVAELAEQGFVRKEARGRTQVYASTGRAGEPELGRYEVQDRVRRAGLQAIVGYAGGGDGCLMRTLRRALGDPDDRPCGRCSACVGSALAPVDPAPADAWLARRPVRIQGFARAGLSDGLAALDGSLKGPAYAAFMRGRTAGPPEPGLVEHLGELARGLGPFAAVVAAPSRTWAGRDAVAAAVARAVGAPVVDALQWREVPEKRQGEWSNNDQRAENVQRRMTAAAPVPAGRVLVLDDYTGSGATLREAARALRDDGGHKGEVVPLTVARVRWRLGRPGLV
ncbi:MAG: RecQ family ATP-dependent DNA helicase [Myxococcota bacterium]